MGLGADVDLVDVGRKGAGPPLKHYVQFSHEEWEKIQKFDARLASPSQLKSIILRIAGGELVIRKTK